MSHARNSSECPGPREPLQCVPRGRGVSFARREVSLSAGLVEEAESSVQAPRLVSVSGQWPIPSATRPSCHAWPARWTLKSRRTWLSVELVLPSWLETDVGSFHLLALRLLDVFVPLSLCTHHLVINVADQLLGSLGREDINTKWMDSHAAKEKEGTSRSRAVLRAWVQEAWGGLLYLSFVWKSYPKLGRKLSSGGWWWGGEAMPVRNSRN